MCLRTAVSCESRSSMRPDTDPATRLAAVSRLSTKLKKVCKRQVIMRIDPCARAEVSTAYLGCFETCQYIRAQPVDDVRAVALVLGNTAGTQVAIAVVFLAAVK